MFARFFTRRRTLLPSAVRLSAPVLAVVLAATAIPIELRKPVVTQLSVRAYRSDVFLNIVGYVPVGLVLSGMNPIRVAVAAGRTHSIV